MTDPPRLSAVHPAPYRGTCPSCGGTIRAGNDQHTVMIGEQSVAVHANPVCVKQLREATGALPPVRGLRVNVLLDLDPEQVERLRVALGGDPADLEDRLPGGAVAQWARELVSAAIRTLPNP